MTFLFVICLVWALVMSFMWYIAKEETRDFQELLKRLDKKVKDIEADDTRLLRRIINEAMNFTDGVTRR